MVRHIAEDGSHIQVIRNKQKAILLLGIGIALYILNSEYRCGYHMIIAG